MPCEASDGKRGDNVVSHCCRKPYFDQQMGNENEIESGSSRQYYGLIIKDFDQQMGINKNKGEEDCSGGISK